MILFKAFILVVGYMLMWTLVVLALIDLLEWFCQTQKFRILAKSAKKIEQLKALDLNTASQRDKE
jgi:hypothetical protein